MEYALFILLFKPLPVFLFVSLLAMRIFLFVLLILSLLLASSSAFTVDSTLKWNDVDMVEANKLYDFDCSGQIWTDWFIDSSADGYETPLRMKPFERFRRMPEENFFSLICCVGQDETYESCQLIGEKNQVAFEKSGQLSCFANDLWLFYWNNIGSLEVTMTPSS